MEQLPCGTAGSLPGQMSLDKFLDDGGDGDGLAPALVRPPGVGALTGVNAAGKVSQCDAGRLAGLRQGQGGILAQHHANGVRLARQPPHDVKRFYPTIGNPNAKAGEGGIP